MEKLAQANLFIVPADNPAEAAAVAKTNAMVFLNQGQIAIPQVAGHIAAIRAYSAALRGDASTAAAQAGQALAQLCPEDQAVRSVVTFALGGVRLMSGDFTW